jgi:hypothetical protein
LYGDQYRSAGRDDRQDGSESPAASWDAGFPANPVPDDLKVAGAPIAEQPPYAHDANATAALPPLTGPEQPPYAHDANATAALSPLAGAEPTPPTDFEDMRRAPRSSRKLIKVAAIAAAVVVVGGGGAAWAMTGDSGSGKKPGGSTRQVEAAVPPPAPLTDAQRKDVADKRRVQLKKLAVRAARDEVSRPMLFTKGTPPPTKKPTPPASGGAGDPIPAGAAQQIARAMLPGFGWSPSSQFGCLVNLWNRESGWNAHAANPSGAYGIPQALPGRKMASAGSDWQNNATTQIKWGLGYIQRTYQSPCGAWAQSQRTGSY